VHAPQSCRHIIVGARSAIEAARRCGLVGQEAMAASSDFILEFSSPRFRHYDAVMPILAGVLFVLRDVS